MKPSRRLVFLAILGFAVFLAGTVAAFHFFGGSSATTNLDGGEGPAWSPSEGDEYEPSRILPRGSMLTMVFVSSSWCVGNSYEGFHEAVRTLKSRLSSRGAEAGYAFSAIGVALDWKTDEGVAYLDEFGKFDQVSVGGNWMNNGLARYVYEHGTNTPEIPQILLFVEEVVPTPWLYEVRDLVTVKVGPAEIVEWARDDAAIDLAPPVKPPPIE